MIDFRTVSDLAQMLDDSTRTELLRSFQLDASSLIDSMETASGKDLAQARHGLIGIAGMIGARRLQAMAQEPEVTVAELRELLAQTVERLESEFFRASAQVGDQSAG